jgi:RNase P subunit RPR2
MTDARSNYMNGSARSATMTSATPRSGESFASSISARGLTGDFNDDDRIFERIFLGLQQSAEMVLRTLPTINEHFVSAMKQSIQQGNPDHLKHYWQILCQKCAFALQTADSLKARLSLIKLKEPGIRTQSAFWELCNVFMSVGHAAVQIK